MNNSIRVTCPKDLQFLRPVVVEDLQRIGNSTDGGYVMTLTAIENCDHFLSLGLGENWSFEEVVSKIKPNAKIDIFDHTVSLSFFAVKAIKGLIKYFLLQDSKNNLKARLNRLNNYYSFWIKGHNNKHHRVQIANDTFEEVLSNQSTEKIIGLKIDIEGSEWEILNSIAKNQTRFEFLLIEIHDFDRYVEQLRTFLGDISENFVLAHLHANNFESVGVNGFPGVFEVTLLRAAGIATSGEFRNELPIPGLDTPNAKNRPDFVIDFR